MTVKLSDEDLRHAVRWFSRQPEGAPFFAFLRSTLMEIGPVEASALQRHDERRRFAADLIAMAEAEKRDGPDEEFERRNGTRPTPRKSLRRGPAGR